MPTNRLVGYLLRNAPPPSDIDTRPVKFKPATDWLPPEAKLARAKQAREEKRRRRLEVFCANLRHEMNLAQLTSDGELRAWCREQGQTLPKSARVADWIAGRAIPAGANLTRLAETFGVFSYHLFWKEHIANRAEHHAAWCSAALACRRRERQEAEIDRVLEPLRERLRDPKRAPYVRMALLFFYSGERKAGRTG